MICFQGETCINWKESCFYTVCICVNARKYVYVLHMCVNTHINIYIYFNTNAVLKGRYFLQHSPVCNTCRFDFVYDNDLFVTAHRGS